MEANYSSNVWMTYKQLQAWAHECAKAKKGLCALILRWLNAKGTRPPTTTKKGKGGFFPDVQTFLVV